jgi:hypothetical protein
MPQPTLSRRPPPPPGFTYVGEQPELNGGAAPAAQGEVIPPPPPGFDFAEAQPEQPAVQPPAPPPAAPQAPTFGDRIGKAVTTGVGRGMSALATGPAAFIPGVVSDESAYRLGRGATRALLPSTKLADYYRGPAQLIAHPIDSMELLFGGIADAQKEQGERAVRAYDEAQGETGFSGFHRRAAAGIQGVLAGVPLLGPAFGSQFERINTGVERGDKGEVLEGVGGVGGLTAGLFSGEAANRGGNMLAKGIGGKLKGMLPDFTEGMTKRIPGEQFTGADIVRRADQAGIKMLPGDVPGASRSVKLFQAAGEKGLTGAGTIQRAREAAVGKLREAFETKQAKYDPKGLIKSMSEEDFGAAAQGKVEGALDAAKGEFHQGFDDLFKQTGKAPADLSSVYRAAKRLKAQTSATDRNLPSLAKTGANAILDDFIDMSKPSKTGAVKAADIQTLQQMRSRLLEESRTTNDPHVRGVVSQMAKQVDSVMEKTMKRADPAAYKEWRTLNSEYREFREVYTSKSSPFTQAIKEVDATKVGKRFLPAKGGSSFVADRLSRLIGDEGMNLFRSQFLEDLIQNSGGIDRLDQVSRKLQSHDPAFLKSLFGNASEVRDLQKLGRIAKSMYENVNPSGTGQTAGAMMTTGAAAAGGTRAMMQLGHGDLGGAALTAGVTGAYVGAPYGIAKLLTAEPVRKFLTTPKGIAAVAKKAVAQAQPRRVVVPPSVPASRASGLLLRRRRAGGRP